jgi:hypothetical protein
MATERFIDIKVRSSSAKKNVDDLDSSMKNLGRDTDKAAKSTTKLTKSAEGVKKGIGGIGRSAGQAGIQVQQFVGQIQGGQSAMLALSQQSADLGFVLGAPLLGAVVGIGASLVGFLIPSLKETKDEAEELTKAIVKLAEKTKLTQEQADVLVAAEQKKILENAKTIASEQKLQAELQKGIDAYKARANEIDEARAKGLENGRTIKDLSAFIKVETRINENKNGVLREQQLLLSESVSRQQLAKASIEEATKAQALYNSRVGVEGAVAIEEQKKSLSEFIDTLDFQAKSYGKSAREVALLTVEQQKGTQADKDRVNAIFDLIDAEKARIESAKNAIKEAAEAEAVAAKIAGIQIRTQDQESQLATRLANDLLVAQEFSQLGFEQQQIADQLRLDLANKYYADLKLIRDKDKEDEINAEMRGNALVVSAKQATNNALIGLLGAFAGKSKKIALAMLALQKASAISQAWTGALAGSVKVFGELPYPAAQVASGKILAQGKLTTALIAATGLAQGAGILSGGSSVSSSSSIGGGASINTGPTPQAPGIQSDVVENTAITDLTNELRNRDPDEPLTVEFTRRIVAAISDNSGQV